MAAARHCSSQWDGQPRQWRLSAINPAIRQRLLRPARSAASQEALPRAAEANRIARMIEGAVNEPAAGQMLALELYLLAVAAFELEWHQHASSLLNRALEQGLDGEYQAKAERVLTICRLKLEG